MKFVKDLLMSCFKGIGIRGVFNWLIVAIALVAIFKACYKEYKYDILIEDAKKVKPVPKTEVSIEAEEIKRDIDTSGRERVVYKLSKPIIEKIENNIKIDSFARMANVDKEKIRSITGINGTLVKENTELRAFVEELKDGLKDTTFRYADDYISMMARRKNDTVYLMQSLTADASAASVTHEYKKFWFLGKPETRSTVLYKSPYIRVNGLDYMTIKAKEPVFDMSLDVEGMYLFNSKEVLLGPMGTVRIGRFKVHGGYLFGNDNSGPWAGGSYKLY